MGFRIPSSISGALSKSQANMVFNQQPACSVIVYSNKTGKTRVLFSDLLSVECSRDISDVGGSFSFTLAPTAPWDEIINADDFVRIFMGDTSFSNGGSGGFYTISQSNFSPNSSSDAGPVDLGSSLLGSLVKNPSIATIEIPNSPGKKVSYNKLFMYERFVGKVDRVSLNDDEPGQDHGSVTTFTVTGRSIGSILQDITLYYNEWIPGLNAVNLFYDSDLKVEADPTYMIEQFVKRLLTTVPFPQWRLPSSLSQQYLTNTSARTRINETVGLYNKMISKIGDPRNLLAGAKPEFITNLISLMTEFQGTPFTSPMMLFSFDGLRQTYGKTFNADFLRSTTTGVMDLIKNLSNDFANELFVDLCPDGNPDSGSSLNGNLIPTIVLRQRPYDITDSMLEGGLCSIYQDIIPTIKDKYYAQEMQSSGISIKGKTNLSLEDISDSGFSVFGSLGKSDISYLFSSNNFIQKISGEKTQFIPTLIKRNCGFSSHDRFNGFQVLPRRGGAIGFSGGDKVIAAFSSDGYIIDPESISKYGFRMMETQSIYCEPNKENNFDYQASASAFTRMLANWHFINPYLLNGTMTCRFLPEARLGVPCRYFETAINQKNPYPKMELYYVQGVTDSWVRGGIITTTLSLTRGLRYDLSKSSDSITTSFLDSSINGRAASALGSIV